MAPFAPSGPKSAAAAGPCNTVISSTSSGLISALLGIIVPSTTYNAPPPDPRPFSPRKRTTVSAPNLAADWLRTCAPATLPAKALLMLV